MTTRLRRAKRRHDRALAALAAAEAERAAAALEARRLGRPLREIAAELGVTHGRVFQITNGLE